MSLIVARLWHTGSYQKRGKQRPAVLPSTVTGRRLEATSGCRVVLRAEILCVVRETPATSRVAIQR